MNKLDQRLILGFDWLWFLAMLALSAAGVAAIWSTTDGTSLNSYFGKQVAYLCCALLVFLTLINFDYHLFSDFISIIYTAGMAVLGMVLVIGRSIHANKSWIDIGLFSFQPSELVKIIAVIALAKYYSEHDRDYLGLRELTIGGLIVFAPALMVVLQGDLGTAVTFFPIYAVLSCLAGIKKKHVIVLLLTAVVVIPVAWFMLRG
jgi:rod shape determining protein RodA